MEPIHIAASRRNYDVHFVPLAAVAPRIASDPGSVVIADHEVVEAWSKFLNPLSETVPVISVTANENLKSLRGMEPVIEKILMHRFRKTGVIYVIGGGAVQDLGGFLASVIFRGVEWIYIPTTLSSQGDSCIGSKTSINATGVKNILGTFWPPSEVIIDTQLLTSLPSREINAGFGELAHYFMLASEDDLSFLDQSIQNFERFGTIEPSLIRKSLSIKKPFIEADEFDKGPRQLLNLGHTFAHGIESATRNRVTHGEAVALGLEMCARVSSRLDLLDSASQSRAEEALVRIIHRIPFEPFAVEEQVRAMSLDKKNLDGDIQLILLTAIGNAIRVPLATDSPDLHESIHETINLWKESSLV